jgi:hypothetical protein
MEEMVSCFSKILLRNFMQEDSSSEKAAGLKKENIKRW